MRREWIEITFVTEVATIDRSPSMRREWIEIDYIARSSVEEYRLPPCGGSGLK